MPPGPLSHWRVLPISWGFLHLHYISPFLYRRGTHGVQSMLFLVSLKIFLMLFFMILFWDAPPTAAAQRAQGLRSRRPS
jgi:hypothetical protein